MEGQFPDDSHLLGELHQTIGDMAEKQAFDALRAYFNGKREAAAVIINGLEMLELDLERRRRQDKREIDFLMMNYTHHYLMNMEQSKTLCPMKLVKMDYSVQFNQPGISCKQAASSTWRSGLGLISVLTGGSLGLSFLQAKMKPLL